MYLVFCLHCFLAVSKKEFRIPLEGQLGQKSGPSGGGQAFGESN